jgi:hypothetical protein
VGEVVGVVGFACVLIFSSSWVIIPLNNLSENPIANAMPRVKGLQGLHHSTLSKAEPRTPSLTPMMIMRTPAQPIKAPTTGLRKRVLQDAP